MKEVKLIIKKGKCVDKCPIPLNLIPKVETSIKEIKNNLKTKKSVVIFDEKKITKNKVIHYLKKIGYEVQE